MMNNPYAAKPAAKKPASTREILFAPEVYADEPVRPRARAEEAAGRGARQRR